jgi:hypothetical protein
MSNRSCMIPLVAIATIALATQASAEAMVRQQKVISSAGARAMVDACTAWAERNHVTVAMSVLDWGGNLSSLMPWKVRPPMPSTPRY